MTASWDDMIAVGQIARTHGLRGEVVVNPATDFLDDRFRVGQVMFVEGADGPRTLTLRTVRVQQGRPIVAFEGVTTVEEAEALGRGELRMTPDSLGPLPPATYYVHDLVGCEVAETSGQVLGKVMRVDGGAGTALLVVGGRGREVLVPMVAEFCVEVRPDLRRIVVTLPEGLADLNA